MFSDLKFVVPARLRGKVLKRACQHLKCSLITAKIDLEVELYQHGIYGNVFAPVGVACGSDTYAPPARAGIRGGPRFLRRAGAVPVPGSRPLRLDRPRDQISAKKACWLLIAGGGCRGTGPTA